ncbi:MAG TPA: type I methionyl aminopeptidase [Armatimonadetes bacterium]|nr:type I methionyl aminopeptidase [Armatimonadota bacterium]
MTGLKYIRRFKRRIVGDGIVLKDDEEIERMRHAGIIVYGALKVLAGAVQPGITPLDLDKLAEAYIRDHRARPSFLGYKGYPASTCITVNDRVVHAIPDDRPLREGDIVGLDVAACWDGYHADAAITVPVGQVSRRARRLMRVTAEALYLGIRRVRPGSSLHHVAAAIQRHVEGHGFAVVRDLVGHGIGRELHEKPEVPHYVPESPDIELRVGMTFCIEPMVNAGTHEVVFLGDGWTVVTADGSLSAHFEHTVAVSNNGVIILTLGPNGEDDLWHVE